MGAAASGRVLSVTIAIDFDVAIVGYGPTGQTLAALLGGAGHKIAVFERWPALYPLPRACVCDHEIMRILQQVGVADEFAELTVPTSGEYVWLNAKGETLYHFNYNKDGISGWPSRQMIYQPDLEGVLHAHVERLASVELNQGWQACGLTDHGSHIELTVEHGGPDAAHHWQPSGKQRTVTARYVVGCDGAHSFVRQAAGMPWTDLGFSAEWLVVDYRPHHPSIILDMPEAGQICDPARPITLMRHMGHRHTRWEMMLLPGETAAEMTKPETIWPMIGQWVRPGDGSIERAQVYHFRSGVAELWRKGRVLAAGDAAHLMPPFLGQGLCSGLRDALSLFWRFDLVLRGVAADGVLASYQPERETHVRSIIERAVALGKVVCITDPAEAAKRDAAILSGGARPTPAFPHLTQGILHPSAASPALAGLLSPQAEVVSGERAGRYDDVIGQGWSIITLDCDARAYLRPDQLAGLSWLGAHLVAFGDVAGAIIDKTGAYRRFMEAAGAQAMVVRPDYYVFGGAADAAGLPQMIDELFDQLGLSTQA